MSAFSSRSDSSVDIKARNIDPTGNYICSDLLRWKPKEKVDYVHSMEVVYYFENPSKLLKHIYDYWLKIGGSIIIGVDFYKENTSSHDWPEKTNISIMKLISISEWKKMFLDAGFKNIESWKVGKTKDWEGTLVVTGSKKEFI